MIVDDLIYMAKDLARTPIGIIDRLARVPGVRAMVRQERCNGCSACVRRSFCRFGAIMMDDGKARVDADRCRGCGRCTHLCKRDALTLELRQPRVVKNVLRKVDDGVADILGDRPPRRGACSQENRVEKT